MELVKGISSLSHTLIHSLVTIGNFDGVHLGHQRIIQLAIEKARERNGHCIAYTFRPHPQILLRPDKKLQLLSTYDERIQLISELGVDFLVEEPFKREFSVLEPQQFFTEVLHRQLKAEAIVVGYDFAFGRGRHGHLDNLSAFCKEAGVELTIVQPQGVEGEVISSSKIRQHLLAGRIEDANRLLGREFSYQGTVVKGDGRGRTIGFPTANLAPSTLQDAKLLLPYGVYATCSKVGATLYPSVTNIGVRPTFQSAISTAISTPMNAMTIETHLIDSQLDLYGQTIEVRFMKRLRDEMKFQGVDQLKEQIQKDIELAALVSALLPHSGAGVR